MPSTEDWVEWFGGFAPFVLAVGVAYLMSLRLRQQENKHRYMMLMAVYAMTAAVYGGLAQGQFDYTRPDAVTVAVGRYAVYAATHGFFFAFLALSIVPNYFGSLLAGALATGQQVSLLLGARSTGAAIWYWFIWASTFWLAQALLFILYLRPERDRGDSDPDNGEPHRSMRSSLNTVAVWVVRVLAIVGGVAYLGLFVIDSAWQDLVSRIFHTIMYVMVDIIVKIVVGVVLLWFVKPVLEESVRNFDFSLSLGSTGDDVHALCAQPIGWQQQQQQQQQQPIGWQQQQQQQRPAVGVQVAYTICQ